MLSEEVKGYILDRIDVLIIVSVIAFFGVFYMLTSLVFFVNY